jgi:choline kinase
MLEVGEQSLIARSLSTLSFAGVKQVVIVTGYQRRKIESVRHPELEIIFQYNPFFSITNDLTSLWFARPYVGGNAFLYLHGDLLYDPAMLRRCIEGPSTTILYDSSTGKRDSEAMKVFVKNRLYVVSSKDLRHRISGEFVGICKFGARAGSHLFDEAERLLSRGKLMAYDTEAINHIARKIEILAIDVVGLPWIEIDSPDDLKKASEIILPRIQRTRETAY